MRADQVPADLLRAELARDGARPLLTFYDDATGERIELSIATYDNWVAKTAGLLQDGLSIQPGARVALLLPAHWQAAVWVAACWSVGACVVAGRPGDGLSNSSAGCPAGLPVDQLASADVVVTGPDHLAAAIESGAPEVVALSLRPLGARFTGPLPPGVLDYALEVPSYPDRFVPYDPPGTAEPGFDEAGVIHTLAGLVDLARDRATTLGLPPRGARLLSTRSPATLSGAIDCVLLPLVAGASSVLVRNLDPSHQPGRLAQERVTHEL